jgi:hypothetical protein
LDEVYPLSQHEAAMPLDQEAVEYVAEQAAAYIKRNSYHGVVLLNDPKLWKNTITVNCRSACSVRGLSFDSVNVNVEGSEDLLIQLEAALRRQIDGS